MLNGASAQTRTRPAAWLFEPGQYWPLTPEMVVGAGLPAEPLAAVRLSLVRAGRAGRWHLAPDPARGGQADGCPRLRRAAGRGRPPERREVGLLSGVEMCGWCAARLAVPGPEGAYLALVRQIAAASEWVAALEDAAPSADWLAYARWTARTPFADPGVVPALTGALASDPGWAACRDGVGAAWDRLAGRAEAGWERARQAAGPPGYRALATAACAFVRASPGTRAECDLLTAIAAGPPRRPGWDCDVWAAASGAWLEAVALDADTATAGAALLAAVDEACSGAVVRDVSLLPDPGEPAWQYCSPAAWAQAEYRALCGRVAASWCQRLSGTLAGLLAEPEDGWLLLRVEGWPLTGERDRELAYLAAYPELARQPDPDCGQACGREHESWVVVLHVPGFAALHAAVHDSPHLDVTPGPAVPPGTRPSSRQVRALLGRAGDLAGHATGSDLPPWS